MTPTARSMKYLRDLGGVPWVVERWIMGANIRKDLFGFIDLVCLDDKAGVLGVQVTSGPHISDRIKKAQAIPEFKHWLDSGNRFEVHGWRKVGGKGKRKLWEVRIIEAKDF